MIKASYCTYLKVYEKKSTTAEELLYLRCSTAGSTTAIILAVKKISFIMNESNKIRIGFLEY